MIEHMKFAKEMKVPNPVQVENGDIVKLYPGKPHVYDKAPNGRLYLDGNISVSEDAQSIKDRKNLGAQWIYRGNYFNFTKRKYSQKTIANF